MKNNTYTNTAPQAQDTHANNKRSTSTSMYIRNIFSTSCSSQQPQIISSSITPLHFPVSICSVNTPHLNCADLILIVLSFVYCNIGFMDVNMTVVSHIAHSHYLFIDLHEKLSVAFVTQTHDSLHTS